MGISFNAYAQTNAEPKAIVSEVASACGEEIISIASMQWPSAAILANIHAQILTKTYDCKTQIVGGDLSATISSMATTGQPAIAPEVWLSRVSKIWNLAIENQSIRRAGASFSGSALEGWYIPEFIANNHPDFKSISQIKDYWGVFKNEGEKARFISCPADWACSIINKNILKAYEVYDRFEIIEPKNRFEMDTLIGEAVSKREPALFYYWQPNAILTQFNFLQLDMGEYNQEAFSCLAKSNCEKAKPSAFAKEIIVSVLADRVFTQAPNIAIYFQNAQMPINEMNALLAWQSENNKSAKETATWFVENKKDIWQNWIVN
jgi:glycine betaine/proline transport system substrate-binding protein